MLGVSYKTWRRWELGETDTPNPIALLLRCLDELDEIKRADDERGPDDDD